MPLELDDSILGEHEKFLIYGAYGSGKTELAATAPGPVYYLVIGPRNELKTLRSPGFKSRHGAKKILYDLVLEDGRGKRGQVFKPQAFDEAGDKLEEALHLRETGKIPEFQTLVVENATTLMKAQMDKAIALGSLGGVSNKAFERMKLDNIIQPADSDWGGAQSLMRQFVSWIYHQPLHVVFLAHERVEAKKNRATREEVLLGITPNFVGQQRMEIPALFDNVWRTSVTGRGDSALFEVDTVGDDVVFCKTRVGGVLRDKETNLRLDQVIEDFRSGKTLAERRKSSKLSR